MLYSLNTIVARYYYPMDFLFVFFPSNLYNDNTHMHCTFSTTVDIIIEWKKTSYYFWILFQSFFFFLNKSIFLIFKIFFFFIHLLILKIHKDQTQNWKVKENLSTMALNEIKSVLITDDVNQKCIEILENNDFKVVKNTKLTVDQIKAEIKVNTTISYFL